MARLLLTRPLADSLALQTALAADGIECLIASMLRIQPAEGIVDQLESIAAPDVQACIATSRHAFTQLPAPEMLRQTPLYVVGEQTAAAAIAQGWREPEYVAASSRELIPALQELAPHGKMIYLRGETISIDLALAVPKHNWRDIITYQAIATPHFPKTIAEALTKGTIHGVLFFSPRSAQLCEQALAPLGTLPKIYAYCLSERIAKELTHDCWNAPHIATHPNQHSLLEMVRHHQR